MKNIVSDKIINTVAIFECFKGFVALAAASGLLLLVHADLHELAVRLVRHAHLDPAANYPGIFIDAITHLQNLKLKLLALGALGYALLRFVEAYGLIRQAAWAEVLAAVSGAIYVPFEVLELMRHINWISIGSLLFNIAVVGIMVGALLKRQRG